MSKFEQEIRAAFKKIDAAIEKTIRGGSIDLFGRIVERTPVDTGRLRGNWQAQINSPNTSVLDEEGEAEAAVISKGAAEIDNYKLSDNSIWFSNNLPYAERIENGWSKQRPEGMTRTAVKQFNAAIDKAAKRNKV